VHHAQGIFKQLQALQQGFLTLAQEYKNDFFIGYTHTRRAQVIKFSTYIKGLSLCFTATSTGLKTFSKILYIFIGAGALAGSYIKSADYDKAVKRFMSTYCAGLPVKISVVKNPLDHVSNRDAAIMFLSCAATLQMHLSRIAEDFILYSTAEFGYLQLPEEFCTGSSHMPHKKNPDFMELIRGYTGRVYGNLVSLLVTMKGLPLTYNRDMQLDKEPLFSSVEILNDELSLLAEFVQGYKVEFRGHFKRPWLMNHCMRLNWLMFLVSKKLAFRTAHDIIGKLIRYSEENGIKLSEIPEEVLKGFSPYLNRKELKRIMEPHFAVSTKRSCR